MKYPYSSHELKFSDFLRACFISEKKSEIIIKDYFIHISGKKYIIITNSCRSALLLAYQAIGLTGEVITSPLTCKVAIDPISESGNVPVFADISIDDLNINPENIQIRINKNTIAIQVIHLGGNSCDMDAISSLAKKNNLWVIEDCAQALGSKYKGQTIGNYGDIACFSLIKNAYGIGGGILATNLLSVYNEANRLIGDFSQVSFKLILFRICRNIIDTYNRNLFGEMIMEGLMKLKGSQRHYTNVKGQLFKISHFEKCIIAYQIKRLPILHNRRKTIGKKYYDLLSEHGVLVNNGYNKDSSSYTKFFIYNPELNCLSDIPILHEAGIETMHLEHRRGVAFQERFVNSTDCIELGLINYNKVHDCLISLPLNERFNEEDVNSIVDSFIKILKKNKLFFNFEN